MLHGHAFLFTNKVRASWSKWVASEILADHLPERYAVDACAGLLAKAIFFWIPFPVALG